MTKHYYSETQDSDITLRTGIVMIRGKAFQFITSSGIFSPKKIDIGTRLLVENMQLYGKKILDAGAGYGVVGIVAAALKPEAEVTMVEINERAATLAEKNARINKVNVRVVKGDFFKPLDNETFDCVLINPPIAAGMSKIRKFLEDSTSHLDSGGVIQLVARHNKGGSVIKKMMQEIFGNVEETKKGSGFRIYLSKKK